MLVGSHVCKKAAEWEALVAGEGEELPRGGSQHCGRAEDDDDDDHGGHGVGALSASSVVENLEVGEAGFG